MKENRTDENPSRRDLFKGGAAVGSLASAMEPLRAAQPKAGRDSRPNFVIFMTDGQRPDEFSIAGNPVIQTPHMDRVCREGMSFRNAFVTNSLCAPSRGTILTGLYSRKNGVIDNKRRSIAHGIPLFTELLQQAGYEVAFCGKSHIEGALRSYYWDYYYGYLLQQPFHRSTHRRGV